MIVPKRPPSWQGAILRSLAWLSLFLLLWPSFVCAAAAAAVPVVTNIAGSVELRSPSGSSRDIVSSQIMHTGDMVVTGVDSLAVVQLADAGRVRLGPGTMTTASETAATSRPIGDTTTATAGANLTLNIASGSVCVESEHASAITIQSGALTISPSAEGTIFDLVRDAGGTRLAVFQGQISTRLAGKDATAAKAGYALASVHDGAPQQVPLQTLGNAFAALHCPDASIAALAGASPAAPPATSSSSGGGGGVIGVLLGLAALAALAGGHGAGSGGGAQSGPSVSPSPPPGSLSVNPTSVSFDNPTSADQQITAHEATYTGSIFVAAPTCVGIVKVSPLTGSGPNQTINVSPQGAGACSISVTDNHGGFQSVAVSVFGSLSVTPASLNFNGTTGSKNITAQETAYGGRFTASGCSGTVIITPPSANGPNATFAVEPISAGTCSITVTDDQGNSQAVSVSVNSGALTANPSSLTFTSASAAAQTFTAAENDFTGAFAVSGCSGVASVAPNPGTGPSQDFSVTPQAPGNCTLSVSDGTNTASVGVTVFGALSLSPNSLSFNGTTAPQTLTAQENFYAGAFTLGDPTCNGVVNVSGSGNGPTQHYSVTPIAAGSCTVTVSDSHGGFDTSTITVTSGTIGVAPGALTFASSAAASQQVTATENDYSGPFTISGCNGVVNASPNPGAGPSQVFSVAPLAAGSCALDISDNHGGSGSVGITVFGSLQLAPASLSFADIGSASAQPFTVNEPFFSGNFGVDASTCAGRAAVGSGPFAGPSASISVTPQNSGSCTINVSDGHGGVLQESITIGPFGSVSPSPNSFRLTTGGATGGFNVSESGYSGTFAADASSCGAAASISPASGTSFTITPGGSAGNCAITVADDHGQSAKVTVFVTSGSMSVSPPSLQFSSSADASQSFVASSTGATTLSVVSLPNPAVATVSPLSASGPSATFTVTPVANGQTSLTVDDGIGGQAVVSIGVGMPPLAKKRHPASTRKPLPQHAPSVQPEPRQKLPPMSKSPVASFGALTVTALSLEFRSLTAPQAMIVFEPNYGGWFSAVSSNANIVTVAVPSARGPNASFTFVPHSIGFTIVRITDDHGGARDIFVSVQAQRVLKPRATSAPRLQGHPSANQ